MDLAKRAFHSAAGYMRRAELRRRLRRVREAIDDHVAYLRRQEETLDSLLAESRRIEVKLFKAENPHLMRSDLTRAYRPTSGART